MSSNRINQINRHKAACVHVVIERLLKPNNKEGPSVTPPEATHNVRTTRFSSLFLFYSFFNHKKKKKKFEKIFKRMPAEHLARINVGYSLLKNVSYNIGD